MPRLKAQYETFCQHYVVSGNAAEAARRTGYSEAFANRQGYRLLRRPAVAQRLAALRAEIAARDCMSLDAQLTKLETAYRQALEKAQPTAAARIIESQTKLAREFARTETETAAVAGLRAELARLAKLLGLPAPAFAGATAETSGGHSADARATRGRHQADAR